MQYAMRIDYINSKTMKTPKIWDTMAKYTKPQFKVIIEEIQQPL